MEDNKEKLDSPLVVHKKTDASYAESVSDYTMEETHIEEEQPTLERHRFKKDNKKGSKKPLVVAIIILVLVVVFGALYLTGNISFKKTSDYKKPVTTTTQTTTSLQEAYKNTIVVKDTYIFVDGVEVDGIEGLQDALKYEDQSTTRYTIIDEDADSIFLNDNVLPILQSMKFYDKRTKITHKESTGLMAKEEIAAQKKAEKKEAEKKAKSKETKKSKKE